MDGITMLSFQYKTVCKGTNGGVTLDGLLVAGVVVGMAFILIGLITAECSAEATWRQLLALPGLCLSLIDSFIGGTLQFCGCCTVRKKPGPTVVKIPGTGILDNNAVNTVSVLLTILLASMACIYIF